MTKVAKFNLCKGVSTGLTFGTPIVTLACMGELFKQPPAAVSAAAVFGFLISALFLKDKILEQFKAPSALVLAVVVFALCVVFEKIIYPMKLVSLMTIAACGLDEVTFKRMYKAAEAALPKSAAEHKKLGYYPVRQRTLDKEEEV